MLRPRSVRTALVAAAAAVIVAGATVDLAHTATTASTATAATSSPTKGVVLINTNLALQNAAAAGTGIVLTRDGEVATNNHVIRGATTIRVIIPATRRTYAATVLGYDIVDDVALLKLQGASGLSTATKGNSATLKIGQAARAVGNANGGGRLVITTGRVTALGRSINVQDDSGDVARLTGLIQTSARLVPGDSGGPLLDSANRVIGIDAAGSPSFEFNTSAPGYAIPINRGLTITKQIELQRSSATVHVGATAFIGLSLAQSAEGVAIGSIVPNSPAANAGLQEGDAITALDGAQVTSFEDVRDFLFGKHPGDSVTISYTDTLGNQTSVTLVLASGPPQ
jgi:S1-C subfamily serine protease